jgi:hypothetical protein
MFGLMFGGILALESAYKFKNARSDLDPHYNDVSLTQRISKKLSNWARGVNLIAMGIVGLVLPHVLFPKSFAAYNNLFMSAADVTNLKKDYLNLLIVGATLAVACIARVLTERVPKPQENKSEGQ